MVRLPALMAVCCLLLTGCAGVKHQRTSHNDNGSGIRYYGSSMYLLAYSDGNGGAIFELQELPDRMKRMEAAPTMFMADLELEMSFSNGVLTSSKEVTNKTAVPNAILDVAKTLGPALLAAANSTSELTYPPPSLYKVIYNDSAIYLIGGQADDQKKIRITLVEQDKEEEQ